MSLPEPEKMTIDEFIKITERLENASLHADEGGQFSSANGYEMLEHAKRLYAALMYASACDEALAESARIVHFLRPEEMPVCTFQSIVDRQPDSPKFELVFSTYAKYFAKLRLGSEVTFIEKMMFGDEHPVMKIYSVMEYGKCENKKLRDRIQVKCFSKEVWTAEELFKFQREMKIKRGVYDDQ